jgi:hypothetical protein
MNRTPRQRGRRVTGLILAGACVITVVAATGLGATAAQAAAQPADPVGPSILNAAPPKAPQLENTGVWHAAPTQDCMTSAYRDGEFLYQGCPWDDEGAGINYTWPTNTLLRNYTYPTDPAYRDNAANLIELRTRPLPDATAFRITYNTMTDPNLVATTIAIGNSAKPLPAPHGANTVLPARVFVTVHGSSADVVDAASGAKLADAPVTVDLTRRQVQVLVPHSAYDPTGQRDVRLAAASGLWDTANNRYLVPRATADAHHPGGAPVGVAHPSAFFDSAFRYDEPMDSAWRDSQQKAVLATGDLSPFHADVDFTKLAAGANDELTGQRGGVPTSGYIERIYASHFELAQGRRLPSDPGAPPSGTFTQQGGLNLGSPQISGQFGWICRADCVPDLAGQLQRYVIYVPKAPAPASGYASMTWIPGYALTPNDSVRTGYDLFHAVGDRPGQPTVVIAVDGRGNDTWGYGQMGASVFEAMADAAGVLHLDPNRRVISGFSSGAYSANKLALQFPDVWSKAFICDGLDEAPSFPGLNGVADGLPVDTLTKHEPGSQLTPLLPSRRDQPVMEWAGVNDDFIPYNITRARANAYAQGDYDYEFISWLGASAEHMTQCDSGTWGVLTKWLGDATGVQDPSHVTYVRDPLMDDPRFGLVGDRAYWLSGIDTRSTNGALGTIDVTSKGFGLGDASAPAAKANVGVTSGTTVPVNGYLREYRQLPPQPAVPKADELDITATNIGAVTIDPAQAKVDCAAKLNVTSNGPVKVTLTGCGPARAFGGPASATPPAPGSPGGLPALPAPALRLPAQPLQNIPQLPLGGVVPPLPLPPTLPGPVVPFNPIELPL